jgi:hypothetical protein
MVWFSCNWIAKTCSHRMARAESPCEKHVGCTSLRPSSVRSAVLSWLSSSANVFLCHRNELSYRQVCSELDWDDLDIGFRRACLQLQNIAIRHDRPTRHQRSKCIVLWTLCRTKIGSTRCFYQHRQIIWQLTSNHSHQTPMNIYHALTSLSFAMNQFSYRFRGLLSGTHASLQ